MSSRVIDGRKFEKKWMQKAKQQFGLNRKGVISLMKKAGIKNLNSRNDLRGMKLTCGVRGQLTRGGKPTGGPSVSTQPTPVRILIPVIPVF